MAGVAQPRDRDVRDEIFRPDRQTRCHRISQTDRGNHTVSKGAVTVGADLCVRPLRRHTGGGGHIGPPLQASKAGSAGILPAESAEREKVSCGFAAA